jgi:hypothetical protein
MLDHIDYWQLRDSPSQMKTKFLIFANAIERLGSLFR